MTLRPASATWSSPVTPGGLADDRRGASADGAPAIDSSTASEVDGRWSAGTDAALAVAVSPSPSAPASRSSSRAASPSMASSASSSASSERLFDDEPPPCLVLAPWTAARAASSLLPFADLERRIAAEGRRETHQSRLVALDQLGLELDEPADDPPLATTSTSSRLSSTRVEPVPQLPLAPELPDRDDLDERSVAGELQHERSRVRCRPVRRSGASGRPVPPSPRVATAPPGPVALGARLHRHDGPAPGAAQADGEARPFRSRRSAVST